MIVLGCITLFIFLMRFVIFKFKESPKFLLAKGHDIAALDVIHSIAQYNKFPAPKLSYDDFKALDYEEAQKMSTTSETPIVNPSAGPQGFWPRLKLVARTSFRNIFGHLRGLFQTRVYIWLFVVLAIA